MSFRSHALQTLRKLASEKEEFTSDDLRDRLLMEPSDPNQVGAVFHEAKRKGIIRATGRITQSKRPLAKRRNIQIWESNLTSDNGSKLF